MHGIAVGICIALQLWFLVTCGIAVLVLSEDANGFPRSPDEVIFYWLLWAKLIAGPVSIALLLAKPNWGRWFTIALFAVYIVGTIAMPILAGHTFIIAYFQNTFWQGQGPLFAFIYSALIATLVFAARQPSSERAPPRPT